MNTETHSKPLLILLVVILAIEGYFFTSSNLKLNNEFAKQEQELQNLEVALGSLPIVARAISVYDVEGNFEIYGKNADMPLPIASLAKSMTVAVALARENKDKIVYLSPSSISQFGDFGLFANEKWKLGDLAKLTLIASANDGAYMLGERGGLSFLSRMNTKAQKIGMEHTAFSNYTGLDIISNGNEETPVEERDATVGAYASATDANIMAMYALRAQPEVVSATTKPEITLVSDSGFTHTYKNTNLILDKIPNILFSKTGFTELAGGNLTVIFENKNGVKFAVTVLGSTMDERFTDMEKIVNVLYSTEYAGRN